MAAFGFVSGCRLRESRSPVACIANPETILGWHRRRIARKFDRSKHRSYPGRPRVGLEFEALMSSSASPIPDEP